MQVLFKDEPNEEEEARRKRTRIRGSVIKDQVWEEIVENMMMRIQEGRGDEAEVRYQKKSKTDNEERRFFIFLLLSHREKCSSDDDALRLRILTDWDSLTQSARRKMEKTCCIMKHNHQKILLHEVHLFTDFSFQLTVTWKPLSGSGESLSLSLSFSEVIIFFFLKDHRFHISSFDPHWCDSFHILQEF